MNLNDSKQKSQVVTTNEIHPFTAPAEMLSTRFFTSAKYRIIIGTAIKTLPAANLANSVSSRLISPTATVYRFFSFNRSFGSMKSLQGQVKEVKAV